MARSTWDTRATASKPTKNGYKVSAGHAIQVVSSSLKGKVGRVIAVDNAFGDCYLKVNLNGREEIVSPDMVNYIT